MPTLQQQEPNGSVRALAEELHELERQEHELETRTDGVEWRQWIAILISAFALAVAIFAAIMALTDDGDDEATSPAAAPAAAAAPPAEAAVVDEATEAARPAVVKVPVELGEMYVRPSTRSVTAGKVRFVVRNVGAVEHELIVAKPPLMMEGPGTPMHDQGLGMTEHMGPGGREQMTLQLKPGKYELFCNVPGHYAAGQRTGFTVTKQ